MFKMIKFNLICCIMVVITFDIHAKELSDFKYETDMKRAIDKIKNNKIDEGISDIKLIMGKLDMSNDEDKFIYLNMECYLAGSYYKKNEITKCENYLLDVLKKTDQMTSFTKDGLQMDIYLPVICLNYLYKCYTKSNQTDKAYNTLKQLSNLVNDKITMLNSKQYKTSDDITTLKWSERRLSTINKQLDEEIYNEIYNSENNSQPAINKDDTVSTCRKSSYGSKTGTCYSGSAKK